MTTQTYNMANLPDIHFEKLNLYPKYFWSHLITQNKPNTYKFTQPFGETIHIFILYCGLKDTIFTNPNRKASIFKTYPKATSSMIEQMDGPRLLEGRRSIFILKTSLSSIITLHTKCYRLS